jgi:hypothetical protein
MKQLLSLFIFLLPCLAWAQYPSNGNQKITLGEQTTADGLIYRGRVTDTTLTVKSDTAAYFVLDTVNLNLYTYKVSASGKKWIQLGSDTTSLNLVSRFAAKLNISDTASMLTPYWRAGRFSGVLPLLNGGTGSATQNFVDLTNTQTVGGAKTFSSSIAGTSATFSGNVAINTTLAVSNYALDVRGATNKRFGVQNSNSLSGAILLFYNDSNGFADGYYDALKMYVQSQSGNETIFASTTDNGAYNVQVNGTGVWGAGAYVNGSDINVKNNIEDLDSSLNLINSLKPVTYKYNESFNSDEEFQVGFIAQDVYQNFENKKYVNGIVKSDGEILSMNYSALIPILTKAIQEQQAQIKALEQRIINLENK